MSEYGAALGTAQHVGPGQQEAIGLPPAFSAPLEDAEREFLRQEFPEMHKDLQQRVAANPLAAVFPSHFDPQEGPVRELREITEFARRMRELKAERPDVFELEKQVHALEQRTDDLGRQLREHSEGSIRTTLEEKLRGALGELFDLREQRREREALEIEGELERIRAILKKRQANRDAIIQRRFNQLAGTEDALDW